MTEAASIEEERGRNSDLFAHVGGFREKLNEYLGRKYRNPRQPFTNAEIHNYLKDPKNFFRPRKVLLEQLLSEDQDLKRVCAQIQLEFNFPAVPIAA